MLFENVPKRSPNVLLGGPAEQTETGGIPDHRRNFDGTDTRWIDFYPHGHRREREEFVQQTPNGSPRTARDVVHAARDSFSK